MKVQATKVVAGLAGGALMAMGVAGAGTAALAQEATAPQAPDANPLHTAVREAQLVSVPHVQGAFAFTQAKTSSTAQIAAAFKGASRAVCGTVLAPAAEVLPRPVQVTGGTRDFEATVDEMAQEGQVERRLLGCACMGNPAGGDDIVNAEVEGVTIASIARLAGALR